MSKLPEGITLKQIQEYAKLDLGIKKLQKRHGVLNALIKQVFTKVGTYVYGNVVVTRGESNKFDSEQAQKEYPEELFPEYYTAVFDPKKLPADEKIKFTSKTQTLSIKVTEENA